jgi:hypothetical protein|tara:strand:+ start:276 stop:563 length:288 start_codon:yes stop_codon:yes gene_type:complete
MALCMSMTLEQVKESKPRAKFYSDKLDVIMTKTQILKNYVIDEMPGNHLPSDLILIQKSQVMREGRVHNFECEFAKGNHCDCWCGEKYHGMRGII